MFRPPFLVFWYQFRYFLRRGEEGAYIFPFTYTFYFVFLSYFLFFMKFSNIFKYAQSHTSNYCYTLYVKTITIITLSDKILNINFLYSRSFVYFFFSLVAFHTVLLTVTHPKNYIAISKYYSLCCLFVRSPKTQNPKSTKYEFHSSFFPVWI